MGKSSSSVSRAAALVVSSVPPRRSCCATATTRRAGFSAAVRDLSPEWIEAEDYDLGGQGIGYFDTTSGNGRATTSTAATMWTSRCRAQGGHAIGWLAAGEWLAYTIDVQRRGLYTFGARVGRRSPTARSTSRSMAAT